MASRPAMRHVVSKKHITGLTYLFGSIMGSLVKLQACSRQICKAVDISWFPYEFCSKKCFVLQCSNLPVPRETVFSSHTMLQSCFLRLESRQTRPVDLAGENATSRLFAKGEVHRAQATSDSNQSASNLCDMAASWLVRIRGV